MIAGAIFPKAPALLSFTGLCETGSDWRWSAWHHSCRLLANHNSKTPKRFSSQRYETKRDSRNKQIFPRCAFQRTPGQPRRSAEMRKFELKNHKSQIANLKSKISNLFTLFLPFVPGMNVIHVPGCVTFWKSQSSLPSKSFVVKYNEGDFT